MASLNPQTIARLFTLSEINVKITTFNEQLEAATVESYDKDTTQGRMKVVSAQIDKIAELLQVYLRAKEILSGIGGVKIVSTNFTDRRRGAII